MKLWVYPGGNPELMEFYCPGCEAGHAVRVYPGAWEWNGDAEHPTLSPSVLWGGCEGQRCHSWVRDGKIEFLGDSTHQLAGQTVDLPERPGR